MDSFNFEKISKYENDLDIKLPERATINSAGYDFCAAEDIEIPSFHLLMGGLKRMANNDERLPWDDPYTLDDVATMTKGYRPTLVPTGIKAKMPADHFLQLSVRSSGPLKHWIILANGVGIIDADYYNNSDNEGEIFFQVYNMSPFPIQLKKGDGIGQGIISPYFITEDDKASGKRVGGFGSTDVGHTDMSAMQPAT